MRLSELHEKLSSEQRIALATRAGTDPGYLWQIATQWRGKRPSLSMIQKLVAADKRLSMRDLVAEFTEPVKA